MQLNFEINHETRTITYSVISNRRNIEENPDSDNDDQIQDVINDCDDNKGIHFIHDEDFVIASRRMGRKSQQGSVRRNTGTRRKEKKSYEKEQNRLLHLRKRKIHRLEVKKDTLTQRKLNIQSRIISCENSSCDYSSYYYGDYGNYGDEILPAEELGIEEGSMYSRLLHIIEGDAITPEDYELLLQLDKNNSRSTLDKDVIEASTSIMEVCNEYKEDNQQQEQQRLILREDINGSHCEICLEFWNDVPSGRLMRRLGCGHMFCKECVDQWLMEVSHKCPNLSCCWCKKD